MPAAPRATGCCGRQTTSDRFEIILADLQGLSALQKNIVRERYLCVLADFDRRCALYSGLYHVGHFVITVGSLIVPALMSIQYADTGASAAPTNYQAIIYWVTWVISLLVTTCNGVITLFKVDKKYYFLHTSAERLRSEGWQYFELTGRYSGQLIHYEMLPTHANQFIFFSHAVEKIKMKQIEEEYYKQEDTHTNPQVRTGAAPQVGGGTTKTPPSLDDTLYTPSPEQPIELISKAVPTAVQDAVNSIIKRANGSSTAIQPNLSNIIVNGPVHENKKEGDGDGQGQGPMPV